MTAPRRRWLAFGPRTNFVVVLVSVALAWPVFYFGIYLGYGNYQVRGYQDFAVNGVTQIAPAAEMDRLFPDCRHYITYGRDALAPIWNSNAFFGGRYELTMQIPVAIESRTKGRATGEPRFYLNEVRAVQISNGQVAASFSRNLDFGPAEWKKIVASGGNFGAIGFTVKTGPPVTGFLTYAKASR